MERRLGEAEATIARVQAVLRHTPTHLASASPTNGWVRSNLVQLALEGLLPVEKLAELARRSAAPETTGKETT